VIFTAESRTGFPVVLTDAHSGVGLSFVLDIPSGNESDHVRSAPDQLEDLLFVIFMCLIHPTILQRIVNTITVPNAITNRSAREKTLASP
jgi:hypothetical protein